MPSPGSIAALSRLSNWQGGGDGLSPIDLEDMLEAQTGLNASGRRELALAKMYDEMDQMDTARAMRRESLRAAESRFRGPEGWDYGTPEDAAFARGQQQKRRGLDLSRELAPMEEDLKDFTSERTAGRHFLPEASALHSQDVEELMNKIRAQYVEPQEERTNLALEQQNLKNKGALDVANARATTAQDRAAKLLNELIRYGRVPDPATGQPRPLTPEEIGQKSREYGVDLPAPAGTVWMRAPNGDQMPVPQAQVQHYLDQGAQIVR